MPFLESVGVCELMYVEKDGEHFSPSVVCDLVMQDEQKFIKLQRLTSPSSPVGSSWGHRGKLAGGNFFFFLFNHCLEAERLIADKIIPDTINLE